MFSDNVGTFRGRVEDCNRVQISKGELVGYLTDFDKRLSDMQKITQENRELLSKNPLLNKFVDDYTGSLEKSKTYVDTAKKMQSEALNNQMNM